MIYRTYKKCLLLTKFSFSWSVVHWGLVRRLHMHFQSEDHSTDRKLSINGRSPANSYGKKWTWLSDYIPITSKILSSSGLSVQSTLRSNAENLWFVYLILRKTVVDRANFKIIERVVLVNNEFENSVAHMTLLTQTYGSLACQGLKAMKNYKVFLTKSSFSRNVLIEPHPGWLKQMVLKYEGWYQDTWKLSAVCGI